MARPRHSRSPSPTGSHHLDRRHRKDDRHRDWDRRDGRDRRRSRSRSPADVRRKDYQRARGGHTDEGAAQRQHRDRERDRDRHWDRDRVGYQDRSLDRRDNEHYRNHRDGGAQYRDRRRSRSRDRDRTVASDRPRQRSRDGDKTSRGTRDASPDRRQDRREGTADPRPRSRGDARPRGDNAAIPADSIARNGAKDAPPAAQTDADKKAERLRKLQAWKEKMAAKEAQTADASAGSTRKLLAEMDQKTNGTPTSVGSPAGEASPQTPYAGKFDPKAIAKKAAHRHQSPNRLGSVNGAVKEQKPTATPLPAKGASSYLFNAVASIKHSTPGSALPQNRQISGFGFSKTGNDLEKPSSKRRLDLDDEETSKRKLAKLPDLAIVEAEITQGDDNAEGESDDDDDDDDFAGDEEAAAAAARAAHEKREERILQQSKGTGDTDEKMEEVPAAEIKAEPEPMQVDAEEEEEIDELDAFMSNLTDKQPAPGLRPRVPQKQAPETYFSDDDYGYEAEDGDPKAILAMAAKRKKKDIPTIDYSKIELNPIRKSFWVEPHELSQLTEVEAAELRAELDGIKVSGKDVPNPVQKWSQCGLTRPILDTIDDLGYEKPTPIQMQALPVIMSGRDVVGVAKTGSGKTMAFLLPMFRHIKDQIPLRDSDGPIGLIMTPTRELAVQIYKDCKPFLKTLGLRAVAAYGGAPIKDQIAELKRGAEIVVATPGRMIDLLAANQGRVTNLKRATYLVLDEADRMFDMGFEPQVMKIFVNARPDRQTILFSATMPRIIDSLTKKVLKNPVEITVGGRSVVAPEITQIVEVRAEKDKFVRLLELLGDLYADDDDVRTLIFVERQEKADELLAELLRRGYACMSLHGGKDQVDRDSTISDFKKGVCPILIATSVAARGLDVKQLKLVVNYDAPSHLEDYVHRAGRTGRAGNTGTAVTFITEEQESFAPGIAKALEQSGQPVPDRLNEMRKAFKEKVKEGKAQAVLGFGGKGLEKLDKDREAARLRERKSHKAEGDEEEDKEEDSKDDEKKTAKATSAVQAAASGIVSRDAAPKAEPEVAKPAAGSVVAGSAAKGGALEKAASAISDINARLAKAGQLRSGQSIDNKGPDAGAFHATLEINDFPQKARWAVTNRTNVAKILEATGTSITNKGTFYPPGKEPQEGEEPKLYILIEGDTEVVVGNALQELTRLLKDGAIAAAEAENRAPASGRYKIT
jgi:ATP-dependent RNA helicase DDX46/PRP5